MSGDPLRTTLAARIDPVCQQFEAAWQSGQQPKIEDFLSRAEPAERRALFLELLRIDSSFRLKVGQRPNEAEYLPRFPSHAAEISGMATETFANKDTREGTNEPSVAPAAPQEDLPQIPDYEVLGVLGRGGMGMVLKARHRVLNRLVAIKLPLAGQFAGADDRERFVREARAAAKLHHPQICPIHEVGQTDGRPYLVLHFVAGKTLGEWAEERKPSAREAASLLARIARAVDYAHEHGVVHRDLKPTNVMIEAETNEPVLMDFGLAKELGEETGLLTESGQVMGTPAYMAPEQAAGQLRDVGPRSDIYALGAILYELVCGRRPFEGGTGEVLKQLLTDEPAAPRKLNSRLHVDLETICLKALAKDPADRYAAAGALADDLERFAAGEPILARREPVWRRMARRLRRSSGVAAALLLLVIAVVAGGYFAAVARRATRLATLKSQFEQVLERGEWTTERLADIDALAAEIADLDQGQSEDLAARVRARLSKDIQSEITDTPSREMDAARVVQLEERIKLVEGRDPQKAKSLS